EPRADYVAGQWDPPPPAKADLLGPRDLVRMGFRGYAGWYVKLSGVPLQSAPQAAPGLAPAPLWPLPDGTILQVGRRRGCRADSGIFVEVLWHPLAGERVFVGGDSKTTAADRLAQARGLGAFARKGLQLLDQLKDGEAATERTALIRQNPKGG